MLHCEAKNCKYNRDGHCGLSSIKINADQECDDFEYVTNANKNRLQAILSGAILEAER